MRSDGHDTLEAFDAQGFRYHPHEPPSPSAIDEDRLKYRPARATTEIITHRRQSNPAHIDPVFARELTADLVFREAGQARHGHCEGRRPSHAARLGRARNLESHRRTRLHSGSAAEAKPPRCPARFSCPSPRSPRE